MKESMNEMLHRFLTKKNELEKKAEYPRLYQSRTIEKKIFAEGFGFYKLFWIFVIGSIIGAIVEIIFCGLVYDVIMSRSSLVFGQFSVVWGLGGVFLTYTLHWFIDKSDRFILVAGTILGGLFEYMCSVFTEKVFGCVFWDYSNIPFNINGRVNLLYCFFWGIASLIWIKICYPWMSHLIEKLPMIYGRILTWLFILFFFFNISITFAALYQMKTRNDDVEPKTWAGRYVETHFSDEWLNERYLNLIQTEE